LIGIIIPNRIVTKQEDNSSTNINDKYYPNRMFGKFIPKRYNKYITRVSTVLIVTMGFLLMTKGLKLL